MKALALAISIILVYPLDAAELYVGVGEPYLADNSGNYIYSLMIQDDDWKYSISRWDAYERSAWNVNRHPTWIPFEARKHTTVSITNTIYSYDFTENLQFFFDFGFSYSSEVNRLTSSHLLFRENIGITYKSLSLTLGHVSNAGLKGDNTGEDSLLLHWRLL